MITAYIAPALSVALEQLKTMIAQSQGGGKPTVIFCEDRLTLAAERTVCAAVEGTFDTSVYTFARFLSAERGKAQNVLSSQGSAMAIRKIIGENRDKLTLFSRLNSATAAQDVYDTIALLYSSRVSPDDLAAVTAPNQLLAGKLRDLEFLYRAYRDYLAENGCMDRNRYLSQLPEVILSSDKIRGGNVVFLGFQSFTCSVTECARACMEAASNVYGLFLGGREDVYTNEAAAAFTAAARGFGGCNTVQLRSALHPAAEQLRKHIFNPESFHTAVPLATGSVHLFEAADEEEEMEYIAANIVRHALEEGVRYQAISVMLPSADAYRGVLERVFSEYGIPYYLDKRYPLSSHAVCDFLNGWLSCVADGCTLDSVSAVVSCPVFHAARKDKDVFINYMLRLAAYRGGVRREPDESILADFKFDISAVQRVRTAFLKGLKLFPAKAAGEDFCKALRGVLEQFDAQSTLETEAEDFACGYPSLSALSARALDGALSVVDEAEKLTKGAVMTAREFSKILKSGFSAMQISLIPPKQDAVFVGELGTTANTGSRIVFAAGLTGDVPAASTDTAVLTDRDLASLEKLNLVISPKIAQVNNRSRELAGLNLCAFKEQLYLSYPVKREGEECGASEMIGYARALFTTPQGGALAPMTGRGIRKGGGGLAYYSCRPVPALRTLLDGQTTGGARSAVYRVLRENGYGDVADGALAPDGGVKNITCGAKLYGKTLSPTALENYFACPYRSFMLRGLKLSEREEGVMRPLDTGNFIHAVLQSLATEINGIEDSDALDKRARALAENLLLTPKYASMKANKRGEYMARSLVDEAAEVSRGMFEQLKNSLFKVSAAEQSCEILLDNGVKLFGRIDRVDGCGEMVRVIDYKTGSVDNSAASYYMGLKLQLPLYLLASSKGKRAVGAYYFPAKVEYEDEHDGVFRLKGYMDGSEDVVRCTDTLVGEKQKSAYVDAYLNGRAVESVLPRGEFEDFLTYGTLVARKGAAELTGGNIAPSPAEGMCKNCAVAGSCGFTVGLDGRERGKVKTDCKHIAEIVKKERGD